MRTFNLVKLKMNLFNVKRIPNKIHYVWIGDKTLPKRDLTYINEWKKINPDYEFYFWDNKRIAEFKNVYLDNAIKLKNWANASNIIRLLALYKYGGIYLDTDIQLVQSLNQTLKHNCFFGFQIKELQPDWVNDAVCGSVPKHWFIKNCIHYIETYFKGNEQPNFSSPITITQLLIYEGLSKYFKNGGFVKDIYIYPISVFYPYNWEETYSRDYLKKNTLGVHHWHKSWELKSESN